MRVGLPSKSTTAYPPRAAQHLAHVEVAVDRKDGRPRGLGQGPELRLDPPAVGGEECVGSGVVLRRQPNGEVERLERLVGVPARQVTRQPGRGVLGERQVQPSDDGAEVGREVDCARRVRCGGPGGPRRRPRSSRPRCRAGRTARTPPEPSVRWQARATRPLPRAPATRRTRRPRAGVGGRRRGAARPAARSSTSRRPDPPTTQDSWVWSTPIASSWRPSSGAGAPPGALTRKPSGTSAPS